MKKKKPAKDKTRSSYLMVIITAVTLGLLLLYKLMDPYKFKVLGGFFELLWLPLVVAIFLLPFVVFISWYKRKFAFRSPYFFAFLISLVTVLLMFVLD